jgi:hypothetical protein
MAKRRDVLSPADETVALLRKLLIVQLGLAGVGQAQIRAIVGGAMGDVNGIVKLLNAKKRSNTLDN